MTPWFFGYGSLVNRATHDHDEAVTAVLHGWRRVWRHTSLREVAYLTAVPKPGASIEGLIAAVPGADWSALDIREAAYDRVCVDTVTHALRDAPDISVYTIPEGKHVAPSRTGPVLLSYIDTVAEGFHREFGEEGVGRFFATTDGWDAPIIDDRRAPRYARHRVLPRRLRSTVERHLGEVGARLTAPES